MPAPWTCVINTRRHWVAWYRSVTQYCWQSSEWKIWKRLVASPAMRHRGRLRSSPPRLSTVLFLVHFRVNLTAKYPSTVWPATIAEQMSKTLISFDQYCISHKTIVVKPLLHPAVKSAVSAPCHNFHICTSSQQILETALKTFCFDIWHTGKY